MVVKLKTHGLTTENIRFQVSKHSSWHYTNTRLQCTKTPVYICLQTPVFKPVLPWQKHTFSIFENTRFHAHKHQVLYMTKTCFQFVITPIREYWKHPFCNTKNTRRVQQYVLVIIKLKTRGLKTENTRFQVSKHSFWYYSNTRFQCTKTPVFIHMNTGFRVWQKPVLICYNTHSRILKTPVFKPGSTTTEKPVFNS